MDMDRGCPVCAHPPKPLPLEPVLSSPSLSRSSLGSDPGVELGSELGLELGSELGLELGSELGLELGSEVEPS